MRFAWHAPRSRGFFCVLHQSVCIGFGHSSESIAQHDAAGLTTQLIDKLGTANYTYNEVGSLEKVVSATGYKLAYEYDIFGNVTGLTYPDGRVVLYEYNELDRRRRT